MRRLEDKATWTVFDPYEVKKKLGFDLNFTYDKQKLRDGEEPNEVDHQFTYWYRKLEADTTIQIKKVVKATDIYKPIYTARKTGGTPYLHFTDTVARMNPNRHKGQPLASNLC